MSTVGTDASQVEEHLALFLLLPSPTQPHPDCSFVSAITKSWWKKCWHFLWHNTSQRAQFFFFVFLSVSDFHPFILLPALVKAHNNLRRTEGRKNVTATRPRWAEYADWLDMERQTPWFGWYHSKKRWHMDVNILSSVLKLLQGFAVCGIWIYP